MSTMTQGRPTEDDEETAQRCVLVSSDSHVGPSVKTDLREYCPQEHLADFDEYVERVEAATAVNIELDVTSLTDDTQRQSEIRSACPGLVDPSARLADMDTDGVAADLLYHGGLNGQPVPFSHSGLASWHSEDYNHLEPVGVNIYNRWLADFVAAAPHRLIGVAHISVRDIESAVREVSWCVEHGLHVVNLPAPRRDFTPYTDASWEPFWTACADLGVTLTTHGGGGDLDGRFTGQAQTSIFLIEYPWMGRRGLWHLIFSGVFERHPALNFSLSEQYGDWVPATLKEMDSAYLWEHNNALRAALPKRPSEYFMSNCYIGASFMSREEALIGLDQGFADRMMWGADYPHPEGSWPHSDLSLRKTMSGFARPTIDAFVSENAIRCYHLDAAALREIAGRIGPTYRDLAVPYDAKPDDLPGTMAFREFGHYA